VSDLPDGGLDAARSLDEQLVAHGVPERVVHGLEPVEVHEEQAEESNRCVGRGASACSSRSVSMTRFRQAGEGVVQHLVREAALEALLVGEVANDPRHRPAGIRRR